MFILKYNKILNKYNIMGRRPGSLNKSTIIKMQQQNNKGGGVSIMHFDKQIENSAIVRPNALYGIMNFGVDQNVC